MRLAHIRDGMLLTLSPMPGPLLATRGTNWVYQPDPTLYEMLRKEIRDHYRNYINGAQDKTTMPLYLFLCGAGTGKSRNAQEFHRSAHLCLSDDDNELRHRIENAWVFHVSLENGISPRPEEVPFKAIGNRMLLQLLPDKELVDIIRDYEFPEPMDVLRLLARNTGQDLKSATVILVVDGLQSFMRDPNDGQDKNSAFYEALTNIADLALGTSFLTVCCTATVTTPVNQALVATHRKRVFLPIASLKPPSTYWDSSNSGTALVFDETDHIIKVLVDDCGGHGRALESLQEVIATEIKDGSYNVECLMNGLYFMLQDRYSEAISISSRTVEAMARAILTRTLLQPDEVLSGTNTTPNMLAIPGLVRFEQPGGIGSEGYFVAPYIWVWLFSHRPQEGSDPLLKSWRFCDYSDLQSKTDPRSPPGAQFWQHFEQFVATFRCLKSRVHQDGKRTRISEVHKGARLNGDIEFTNHHLQLELSSRQEDTKSTGNLSNTWTIQTEHSQVNIHEGKHCIVNGTSAPYGDSFLGLDAEPFCTEVHQCKLVMDAHGVDYLSERNKAASDRDFFILYTSKGKLDVELPVLSGVVDRSNWTQYFGPFAGRAFIFATVGALDINLASRKDIKRMKGIGKKKAEAIIKERTKRDFDSLQDADQRLPGMKALLREFKFPRKE
ncbi:hypothetical protein EDD21DRAFT_193182 [Dissophora ornata]|nr:hypothetical protein EDD21DRAFT_193182 [Dissophora ornata]